MQTDYQRLKDAFDKGGIIYEVLDNQAAVHWEIAWNYKIRPGEIPEDLGTCLRVFSAILMIFEPDGDYIGSFLQDIGADDEEYYPRESLEPRDESGNDILHRPPRWVTDIQARKTDEVLSRCRARQVDSKDVYLIQDVMSSAGVSPDLFAEAQRCKLALYEQIDYEADPGRRSELGQLIRDLGEAMGDQEPEHAIARSWDGGRNE